MHLASGVVGAQFLGGTKVRIFRQRDNFSDKNVTVSGFDFYDSIRQRIENKRREKFHRLIFGFFRQKGENDEFSDNIFSGGALAPSAPPGHDATASCIVSKKSNIRFSTLKSEMSHEIIINILKVYTTSIKI